MGRGPSAMPYLVEGILGAAAISLTLGAVQFSTGRDLASPARAFSARLDNDVNRAAKANRAAAMAPAQPTQTIAFQPRGLAATSVVLHMPATREARDGARK